MGGPRLSGVTGWIWWGEALENPCGRDQEANLANEETKNTLPGKVRSPLCLSGREKGELEA